MKTLSRGAEFSIEKVIATKDTKSDWIIALKLMSSGNYVDIYVTDILRVYTVVASKWGDWVELSDIQKVVDESGINQVQASYIMALLTTFDDIEFRSEGNVAIRYVPHRERFGELL